MTGPSPSPNASDSTSAPAPALANPTRRRRPSTVHPVNLAALIPGRAPRPAQNHPAAPPTLESRVADIKAAHRKRVRESRSTPRDVASKVVGAAVAIVSAPVIWMPRAGAKLLKPVVAFCTPIPPSDRCDPKIQCETTTWHALHVRHLHQMMLRAQRNGGGAGADAANPANAQRAGRGGPPHRPRAAPEEPGMGEVMARWVGLGPRPATMVGGAVIG